jgi:hypothetical protein
MLSAVTIRMNASGRKTRRPGSGSGLRAARPARPPRCIAMQQLEQTFLGRYWSSVFSTGITVFFYRASSGASSNISQRSAHCRQVWGAGVSLEISKRLPHSFCPQCGPSKIFCEDHNWPQVRPSSAERRQRAVTLHCWVCGGRRLAPPLVLHQQPHSFPLHPQHPLLLRLDTFPLHALQLRLYRGWWPVWR